jgi:WD40 repeat protein
MKSETRFFDACLERTGTQIVSESWDKTVRVWEKEGDDWVTKFVLQGLTHWEDSLTTIETPTGALIVSGSGPIVVLGSTDNTVRVWEPTNF